MVEGFGMTKTLQEVGIQNIEDVSFTEDGNSDNCVWDGIINKWMLERNT